MPLIKLEKVGITPTFKCLGFATETQIIVDDVFSPLKKWTIFSDMCLDLKCG